jgi:hypothetical protein
MDLGGRIDMNDREKEFLIGLRELTNKTGVAIGGCGCCGSPFMYETKPNEQAGYGTGVNSDVQWITPDDEYEWEKSKQNIVSPNSI